MEGNLLTDYDQEIWFEAVASRGVSKTKKITTYHTPSSSDPNVHPGAVSPEVISVSGSLEDSLPTLERKLMFLNRTHEDVLWVSNLMDQAALIVLERVTSVSNKDTKNLLDVSFSGKIKGKVIGQFRGAEDSRCYTRGTEQTDTTASNNLVVRLI